MVRKLLLLALLLPFAIPTGACGGKGNSPPPSASATSSPSSTTTTSSTTSSTTTASMMPSITPTDFVSGIVINPSCVLNCSPTCPDATQPWTCPALSAWSALPHDPVACGTFNGSNYPTPQQGKCTATTPSATAIQKTSASTAPYILPDGRRIDPAGNEWLFTDFPGNFPDSALLVPGTNWLLVVDNGYTTHSVRAVNTTTLRTMAGTNPVSSSIAYMPPKALNWGMAYVASSKLLYVASGYQNPNDTTSLIYAYDFDTTTGALTVDKTKSIALPSGTFPQAVAVSPDGSTMLVGQVTDSHVLAISLATATYGTIVSKISVGADDVFELRFDPNDATGNTAYATLWISPVSLSNSTAMRLAEINVSAATSQTISVGKEPEDMVFLDARYMVVATGLSDAIAIVDRPAAMVVATVPLGAAALEPTALAYDAPHNRLYATLSSANAVEAFDVNDTTQPPTITPAGRIPTSWWPTAVVADTDGTLYVTTGRGHGTRGLNTDGDDGTYIQGSVQAIPYADMGTLATTTTTAEGDANIQAYPGYPTVQCNGAAYDFPVPATNTGGASTLIKNIIFVERENKTFDALFGDLPGVDGDPAYLMSPMYESSIWQNVRKIATTFSHMDNYYSDAEQSIQGHYWDVFGRTSDVDERRWLVTWSRSEFDVTTSPGVSDFSAPLEGSIFQQLTGAGITIENDGELVAGLAFRNYQWPAGTTDDTIPDTIGACYLAARARATCDVAPFTYAWFPNDHTFGLAAGDPNPSIMIATNDEATGMLLDGISHSPMWATTLVIVIEDDPSQGQDHVDMHRTISVLASPWVKRGYVSHGHYDVASLHKLMAHIYGQPYPNAVIENAALPLDLFTSTPDYTPYEYIPRTFTDDSCNPTSGVQAQMASGWNFGQPDEQPGLGKQVTEYMKTLK